MALSTCDRTRANSIARVPAVVIKGYYSDIAADYET